jgi:hypothetical protein
MSPDWADKPEPVPYADLNDPQSLNLYGYVRNNPLSHADADGHCCDWNDVVETFGGAVNAFNQNNGVNFGSQSLPENDLGRAIGDSISLVQGVGQMVGGGFMAAGGTAEALTTSPAALTVVGGVIPGAGVATAAAGVAIAANGAKVAGSAILNFKAGGNFSSKTKQDAKDAAGGKCQNCGATTTPGQKSEKGVTPPGTEGQTDHKVPKSKGGTNEPSNAQHFCRDCNLKKSDKLPNQQ